MRNLRKADQIKKITRSQNLPLSVIELDVTSEASVDKAIDTVISQSGRIEVLVNNSGYSLLGSIEDMSIEVMEAQYVHSISPCAL